MNMLRGAVAFLCIVVLFVFAECKKEATSTSTSTAKPANPAAQMAGGKKMTCPGAPMQSDFCAGGSGDCEIWAKIKSATSDTSVSIAEKVWIDAGQTVKWHGKEDDTQKVVKVKQVQFKDNTTSDAECLSGDKHCSKKGKDFTPCVSYKYTIVLKQDNDNEKTKDPEIEVGSVNGGKGTDTSGTSTSGTSGTSGTHT